MLDCNCGSTSREKIRFDDITAAPFLLVLLLDSCSLVPSPTPSFSSLLSTVKRGGPGTFPHVSDVKGRKG